MPKTVVAMQGNAYKRQDNRDHKKRRKKGCFGDKETSDDTTNYALL